MRRLLIGGFKRENYGGWGFQKNDLLNSVFVCLLLLLLLLFLFRTCQLFSMTGISFCYFDSTRGHSLLWVTSFSERLRSSRRIFLGHPDVSEHFGFNFFSRLVKRFRFSVTKNFKVNSAMKGLESGQWLALLVVVAPRKTKRNR